MLNPYKRLYGITSVSDKPHVCLMRWYWLRRNFLDSEIKSLRAKTSLYQIDCLNDEESHLKSRCIVLQKKGFYENYLEINRLNNELKKVKARIDTLKMREASGGDVDVLMKIARMEKEFNVEYKLYVSMIHLS